jgi:hypothetical protein
VTDIRDLRNIKEPVRVMINSYRDEYKDFHELLWSVGLLPHEAVIEFRNMLTGRTVESRLPLKEYPYLSERDVVAVIDGQIAHALDLVLTRILYKRPSLNIPFRIGTRSPKRLQVRK